MRRTAAVVLLGILAALPAGAGAVPEPSEDRYGHDIPVDEKVVLEPLALERPAVHEIVCGGKHLTIRAMPTGLLRFVSSDVTVSVWILDAKARVTTFKLRAGERASVWPVRRLEVRGKTDGFAVIVTAADWAFVVRADQTLKAGLRVRCHGISHTLFEGQRIDADREDGEIVFRVIGNEWPGRLIEAPKPTPEREGRREVRAVAAEEGPPGPAPLLPFLVTGWASWEVRPAQPVSP